MLDNCAIVTLIGQGLKGRSMISDSTATSSIHQFQYQWAQSGIRSVSLIGTRSWTFACRTKIKTVFKVKISAGCFLINFLRLPVRNTLIIYPIGFTGSTGPLRFNSHITVQFVNLLVITRSICCLISRAIKVKIRFIKSLNGEC
jgi:hypothetical protein